MRIITFALIALIFIGALTACNANKQDGANGEKLRVAIALGSIENTWHAQLRKAIDIAVAYHPNIEWTVRNARDAQDQINMLAVLKDEGYDAIVIMPIDGNIIVPIAEAIFDDGTPTIILNRRIASDKYTALIAGDNYGGAVNAARLIGQALEGEGDIAILRSFIGTPIDTERYSGFTGTLEREFPNINIVAQGDGMFNSQAGYTSMTNILASSPHIDALFSHDDEAIVGALIAISEAGRTDIRYIVGFGGGAMEETSALLKNDSDMFISSMSYFPGMGFDVVEKTVRILRGIPFPKETIIASQVMNASNIDEFLNDIYSHLR